MLYIKERTQAILHPEKKMEISTIPANHAYIPKKYHSDR